jgi:uncharacterized membrane protein YeaQ/YmgE (transglycosylase-associated protein family)
VVRIVEVAVFGAVAAAIAYLIVRHKGGPLRNVVAYLVAALVTAVATPLYGDLVLPRASGAVQAQFWLQQSVAILLGPIVGLVIAGARRRNAAATTTDP